MGSEHPVQDEPVTAAEEEGGDPVCWAHLVCPECGAVTSEGHRDGCASAREAREAHAARQARETLSLVRPDDHA